MADQVAAVAPSNTAPARAQVLADMPWDESPKTTEAADAAPKTEKPVEKVETAPEDDAVVETKTDEDKDKPAEKVEAKPTEEPAPDPADAKRMSAIAKAEKRSRELLAKERAEAKAAFDADVERIKSELMPKADAARKYEAAVAKARTNPVELLRSLGLTEDDFAYAAQQIYNHSKEAATDPKRAQAAAQARKEREKDDEVAQLRRQLEELVQGQKKQTEAQQIESQKASYLADIAANLPAEAPLLKKLLEKSPAKAKAEMWQEAERLYAATGEMPDADDIAEAYEKRRRSELEELGIDVATVLGAKPAPAGAAPVERATKTLDTSTATPVKPAPVVRETAEERRARLLKEMPWDAS